MEGNKEEALRCLSIAQRHRNASNFDAALRFARKSVALYATPEAEKIVLILQEEVQAGGAGESSSGNEARSPPTSGAGTPVGRAARASGVEEHVSSARQRPGKAPGAGGGAGGGKEKADEKREYTAKMIEVVTRVKRCRGHAYYEILAVEKTCSENDVKRAYKKLALALHPDKNSAPGADEAFKSESGVEEGLGEECEE